MDVSLEPAEARVLGVLIEKQLTTPDQYPLSLNALQAGCNQKSNRDPGVEMAQGEVFSSVERLRMMRLAGAAHPAGSRVERFAHSAREVLEATDEEIAVLAELLLRGPQTKGDLRARASRMAKLPDQGALSRVLASLAERGLVHELPPAPGSRAARVADRLTERGRAGASAPTPRALAEPASSLATGLPDAPRSEESAPAAAPAPAPTVAPAPAPTAARQPAPGAPDPERVRELEQRIARLERGLEGLARSLGENLEWGDGETPS